MNLRNSAGARDALALGFSQTKFQLIQDMLLHQSGISNSIQVLRASGGCIGNGSRLSNPERLGGSEAGKTLPLPFTGLRKDIAIFVKTRTRIVNTLDDERTFSLRATHSSARKMKMKRAYMAMIMVTLWVKMRLCCVTISEACL
jgi:hypothetical protein